MIWARGAWHARSPRCGKCPPAPHDGLPARRPGGLNDVPARLTRPMPATVQPAAEPSAHHLCTARPCAVALPIDFTAFCELRYAVYLRYARCTCTTGTAPTNAVQDKSA